MKKIWLAIPLVSLLALPTVAQDKQEKEERKKAASKMQAMSSRKFSTLPTASRRTSSTRPTASSSFLPFSNLPSASAAVTAAAS